MTSYNYKKKQIKKIETKNKKSSLNLIFSKGHVSSLIKELVLNIKKMLIPNIVNNVQVKRYNKLKDLLNVAGVLGITFFWICTQSELGVKLRLIRVPHGPSLTFRIEKFSLSRNIISFQKKPEILNGHFNYPLVILNNFSKDENHQIISTMFQNIFPTLKIRKVNLSDCNRACLFDYNAKNEIIQIRHYKIKNSHISLNKKINNIIEGKKIPNMKNYLDISQYFENSTIGTSESETENFKHAPLLLSNEKSDVIKNGVSKSAICLKELGPRISLRLLKVENKMKLGRILYSRCKTKSSG